MGVVFTLGIVIFMLIVAIITAGMIISLIAGIILLIVGSVKKKKYQSKGINDKTSGIMISIGIIMTTIPTIIALIFCTLRGLNAL